MFFNLGYFYHIQTKIESEYKLNFVELSKISVSYSQYKLYH